MQRLGGFHHPTESEWDEASWPKSVRSWGSQLQYLAASLNHGFDPEGGITLVLEATGTPSSLFKVCSPLLSIHIGSPGVTLKKGD